ncbi:MULTISPECIES: hypothetical protein [unclassified Streptomyces]|nr:MULTISPECIES: hypothetical protein [unclassified Streptomyces]ODA72712.1 hypothetical protein APS67_003011 [Streptomyces sp. AVP053U2]
MEPAITVGPDGPPGSPAAGSRAAAEGRAAVHPARRPVTVVPHD